ncbi:MAG: ATP-binding cassette domain-containing protein, partial [Armatimonadota bacterium]
FKNVGDLSGGEQSRLSLAKLVMTGPTFLVLDEPTNHLDIDSCNALENALKDYSGTILVVSHDRFFLDNVVSRLVVFHEEGVKVHEGNYGSWVARTEAKRAAEEALAREQQETERQERLRLERLARKAKKERASSGAAPTSPAELEARIEALEGQLERLELVLADPVTYDTPARVQALTVEHQKLTEELDATYHRWHEATEE